MRVDDAFTLVRHAIESHRSAHAYLIAGAIRGNALELAERVLQLFFCQADAKPCGECEGCQRIIKRIEPDVHWVYPEKKTRIISVKQMREQMLAEISKTAFGGAWKAGVLVGAECMNESSANAFLKTLEEPPEKTIFLLLSAAPQNLLPTVRSRCQMITLEDSSALPEGWRRRVVEILSSESLGRPLENLSASTKLATVLSEIKEEAERLVKEEDKQGDATQMDDDDVMNALISSRYREMRTDFLRVLLEWFRDLLVVKCGGERNLLRLPDQEMVFNQRANRLSMAQIMSNLEVIESIRRQFERNMPEEGVLAYGFDRLHHGAL